MKLILGLGNPGRAYAGHRHNMGFQCLDHFARSHHLKINQRLGRAVVGRGEIAGVQVILAKPRTYMNLSGQAVAALMRRLKITPNDLLVIYDDLDLPLGKIRIRERGGAGGHKGMASIIAHLGSQHFPRIRVGIGRPQGRDEEAIMHYVLSDFTPAERPVAKEVHRQVAEAILTILTDGIATAMNRYN